MFSQIQSKKDFKEKRKKHKEHCRKKETRVNNFHLTEMQ